MNAKRLTARISDKRERIIGIITQLENCGAMPVTAAIRSTTQCDSWSNGFNDWDKWNDWRDFDRINFMDFDDEGDPKGIEVGDPKP